MEGRFKFLKDLVWFTQFGLSIVSPPVLCIFGSVWLKNRFELGNWIVIVGIVLGVLGAVSGLWSSLKSMKSSADSDDKKYPQSYNDHE